MVFVTGRPSTPPAKFYFRDGSTVTSSALAPWPPTVNPSLDASKKESLTIDPSPNRIQACRRYGWTVQTPRRLADRAVAPSVAMPTGHPLTQSRDSGQEDRCRQLRNRQRLAEGGIAVPAQIAGLPRRWSDRRVAMQVANVAQGVALEWGCPAAERCFTACRARFAARARGPPSAGCAGRGGPDGSRSSKRDAVMP